MPLLPIITVIMGSLLPIITRSIIGNNGFIITYYWLEQLGDEGKPLITKARLETVWTRLADRLATVVADTSMITISPEYDLYINGKENAKLTGDHMKLLMLTLPFMPRDLA